MENKPQKIGVELIITAFLLLLLLIWGLGQNDSTPKKNLPSNVVTIQAK